MKRTKYGICYCLLILLCIGCVDEEMVKREQGEVLVTGSLAGSDTRVVYTDNETSVSTTWKVEDAIGLSTRAQSNLKYLAQTDGTTTEFSAASADHLLHAAEGETVYAYYPYTTNQTQYEVSGEDGSTVCLPDLSLQYRSQGLDGYDFIHATGTLTDNSCALQFKHLFTFLKIRLKADLMKDGADKAVLKGLRIKSSEPLSYIVQYTGTGGYTLPAKFSIAQQKLFRENYRYGNEQTNAIACNELVYVMDEEPTSADEVVTCYVALLPQSAKATISIYDEATQQCLLKEKSAPEGGLQSGRMYSIALEAPSEEEQIDQIQREALIAFYKATGGDNWTRHDNWCSDKPLSEWYGITLSDERDAPLAPGYVKQILLPLNNLRGSIPEEISLLTGLKSIELGNIDYDLGGTENNVLTGELPQSMTQLRNLTYLGVQSNQLSGRVPDLASSCPNLKSLDLQDNLFTGPLPEYGNNMRFFHVDINRFTGTIPLSHVRAMTDNCRYGVIGNNLSGDLPEEVVRHANFYGYWDNIIPQNPGYGFNDADLAAPPVALPCYDGTQIMLSNEYAKNEYTLFFLWQPTSSNSISTLTTLSSLYKKYKEKGLEVIAATAYKHNANELTTYFNQMENIRQGWLQDGTLTWVGDNSYLFALTSVPTFYVVNKQGNVIYHNLYQGYNIGRMPYQHQDWRDVYDFVANLFGDATFVPDENPYYTSTDYSRDGEVITLQSASQGKGIDLIFMGEAFVDKDMESGGLYEQKMKEAMEQFFSVEPYKTFRNRFNIYAVKVVSPNAEFAPGAQQRINTSTNLCFELAKKVTQRNVAQPLMISVIYNSTYAGRSYTTFWGSGEFVAFMMEGVNSVLNHEAGGHGFAKLLDEYVEPGNENETLPEKEKNLLDQYWNYYSWGANVDWRNDENTVKWANFLKDSRYTNEGLGLYEGSYLYGYGAYRPTENSMMRFNDSPFNAPSREQIYKTIMRMSEGSNWSYNYEEFVQYDAVNRSGATTRSLTQQPSAQQIEKWKKSHRAPVMVVGNQREATLEAKPIVVPLRYSVID